MVSYTRLLDDEKTLGGQLEQCARLSGAVEAMEGHERRQGKEGKADHVLSIALRKDQFEKMILRE